MPLLPFTPRVVKPRRLGLRKPRAGILTGGMPKLRERFVLANVQSPASRIGVVKAPTLRAPRARR